MMKRPPQLPGLMAIFLIALLFNGCLGLKPKPDPSRYYVLGTGSQQAKARQLECARRILVGPVRFAGHLDDPRIARRVETNEIVYSNWSFWAEPLARAFPRELISSLEQAMPEVCFFDFRSASTREGDVSLDVSVEQFEMTNGERVVAAVKWTLWTVGDSNKYQGSVRLSKSVEGDEDEVLSGILALNRALDEVAGAIAADIK